jgi:hypothetical protein
MPLDHLDWTLAVNVRGTLVMSIRIRAAAGHERAGSRCHRQHGLHGKHYGGRVPATYNASKGAVVALAAYRAGALSPRIDAWHA